MMQEHSQVRMQLNKYEHTTFDTWMLSYEQLSDTARRLLWLLGYMQRDRITAEIFQRAAANVEGFEPAIPLSESEQDAYTHIKDFLGSFLDSSGDWDLSVFLGVIREILSYSLIEYDWANEIYVLHPLVQTWAQTVAPHGLGSMHTAFLLAAALDWDESSEDYTFLRCLHLHVTSTLSYSQSSVNATTACLANVLYRNGQFESSSLLQSQVVRLRLHVLGEKNHKTIRAIVNLAETYSDQGRPKEAEDLLRQALGSSKQVFGEDHSDTLEVMHKLAIAYFDQGHLKKAQELQVQVLNAMKRVLGNHHLHTLRAMHRLSLTYFHQGRQKEAAELRLQVFETSKQVLDGDHPDKLRAMCSLAATYSNQGRQTEAEKLAVHVLNTCKQVLREDHPHTLNVMGLLASIYHSQGRQKEAEELEVQILDASKRVLGKDHPDTLTTMGNLAATYYNTGRLEQAAELETQVLDHRRQLLGTQHPDTVEAMRNLCLTYNRMGEPYRAKYKALSKDLSQIKAPTDPRD